MQQQKPVINLPSLAEIRKNLEIMITPGDVVELRIFDQFDRKYCGWFTDVDRMAEAALSHDDTAEGTYYTCNACKTDMLAVADNRIKPCKTSSREGNIIRRRLFGIDIDPVRDPPSISSTNAEKALAYKKALEVMAWLKEQGFPDPVFGDSGNGYHLDYFVDLPVIPEIKIVYEDAYKAIQHKFPKDAVDVQGFPDANRIWKVYGTVARKGENLPVRPHRRSKLLTVPEKKEILSLETLTKLASTAPQKEQPKNQHSSSIPISSSTSAPTSLKPWTSDYLKRWLDIHGANIFRVKSEGGTTRFVLVACLNNSAHQGNHEAEVHINSRGVIGYKCHHHSCDGITWKEIRAKHDKEYAESQRRQSEWFQKQNSPAALQNQTNISETPTKPRRVKPILCKGIRLATEGVIKGRRGDVVTAIVRAMRFWGEATEEQTLRRLYKFCDLCEPPLQLSTQSLEKIHEFFGSPAQYNSPCPLLINNGLCEEANCDPMIKKRKKESGAMMKEIREAMNAKYGDKNSSPSPAQPQPSPSMHVPEQQTDTLIHTSDERLKEPIDRQKVMLSAHEWQEVRGKPISRNVLPEVLEWIYSHTGISPSDARTCFVFKTKVKVTRDIPDFVGIDETLYSLKTGMETTLPDIFVKNLVKKHAVEIIGEVV